MSVLDILKAFMSPRKDNTLSDRPATIVGLGNPGPDYEHTRHNIGFMVLDRLSNNMGFAYWPSVNNAKLHAIVINECPALLVKPQTFMNSSGEAVKLVADGIGSDEIIIIHDDLDLPFGTVRVKHGGSHGGHRGLRSIIEMLNSENFTRVRLGIGRPPEGKTVLDFVLSPFLPEEQETLDEFVNRGKEATELILREGVSYAQNEINRRELNV
jgi:peptidyl-tRNA hydrolase, PTH1 family